MSTHTIAPIPAKARASYEAQGIDVDAVIAQATTDQQAGVTINAGRAWAQANHPGRAAVLYFEAWLASAKVNGRA
jgi:hypothetical protein